MKGTAMYILIALFLSTGGIIVFNGGNDTGPVLYQTIEACQVDLARQTPHWADAKQINQYGPVLLDCVEYDDDMKEIFPKRLGKGTV